MDAADDRSRPPDLGGPLPVAPEIVRASDGVDAAAVRWSREPRPDDEIVLLLHGLGSHEGDLFDLVPSLPSEYVYASLRGIFAYGPGFAWLDFPLDPARREKLEASAGAVEAWVGNLPRGRVVGAIGFSQGAMLALELLRRDPSSLAWIAPLSGTPVPGDVAGDEELTRRRPPAFWGHGGRDPFVDAESETWIRAWLEERTTLTEVRSPELAHSVDARVLAGLASFVEARRA